MITLGGYTIDADERSVTLYISGASKDGHVTKRVLGHYTSLARVAEVLATRPAHEAIAAGKTVTEIVAAIDAAATRILAALDATPAIHPEQGQLEC